MFIDVFSILLLIIDYWLVDLLHGKIKNKIKRISIKNIHAHFKNIFHRFLTDNCLIHIKTTTTHVYIFLKKRINNYFGKKINYFISTIE